MDPKEQVKERIHAFLGNNPTMNRAGGGLTLPAIFSPIMEHLLDNKKTSIQDVVKKVERGHPGGDTRIREVFGSVENCIEQAFQHLAERNYALLSRTRANGRFCIEYSPFLMPGTTYEIFTVKDDGVSIRVDLQTAEERERIFQEDRRRMLINDWLHDMEATNLQAGFRQLYYHGKLENSIKKHWDKSSNITMDDKGHVINGKRRLVVCHKLGKFPPEENVHIYSYETDEDKLLHAWQLNMYPRITWVEGDLEETCQRLKFLGIDLDSKPKCVRLNKPTKIITPTVTENAQRKRGTATGSRPRGTPLRAFFIENPEFSGSNSEIARKFAVDPSTVTQERQKLEGLGLIKRTNYKRSIIQRLATLCEEFTLEEIQPVENYLSLVVKERIEMLKNLKDSEFFNKFVYGNSTGEDNEKERSTGDGESCGARS